MDSLPYGTLTVKPKAGRITNKEKSGTFAKFFKKKLNPYVNVSCGPKMEVTKVHKKGDRFPNWDAVMDKYKKKGIQFSN